VAVTGIGGLFFRSNDPDARIHNPEGLPIELWEPPA
jgi:hypothetical protein